MPTITETMATPRMNLRFMAGDTSEACLCVSEANAGAEADSDFFLLFLLEGVDENDSISRDFIVSFCVQGSTFIILHKSPDIRDLKCVFD
ncbi:UNVERIFIED_CONTAM: hypothetical protein Sradi_6123400 [Sesamum radiatum]|uniref:Uncharacterized protein n=1 Tax=Sesamum radiatum TaxID=300843 RepID=A0AAW2KM42_SESRA